MCKFKLCSLYTAKKTKSKVISRNGDYTAKKAKSKPEWFLKKRMVTTEQTRARLEWNFENGDVSYEVTQQNTKETTNCKKKAVHVSKHRASTPMKSTVTEAFWGLPSAKLRKKDFMWYQCVKWFLTRSGYTCIKRMNVCNSSDTSVRCMERDIWEKTVHHVWGRLCQRTDSILSGATSVLLTIPFQLAKPQD